MKTLALALFLLVGLMNLLPAVGALSAARLEALYDVAVREPNLEILMRHRALLFAVVGGVLLLAAFHPPLRPLGLAVGLFSMLSFVAVALLVGGANAALQRVVWLDVAGSVALLAAAVFDRLAERA